MGLKAVIGTLSGLLTVLVTLGPIRAQEPKAAAPPKAIAAKPEAGEQTPGKAVSLLVEQLRRDPADPSLAANRVGLFLIDAEGGEATLIAGEPDPHLNRCGSPDWSRDGRRILFDVTPGTKNYSLSRLKAIELDEGRLAVRDLGPGNCPTSSPTGDRIAFLLNPGAVPGTEAGVWMMQADGSERRLLGLYGRPRWSPDGHQILVLSFSEPCEVTVADARPGNKSGVLRVPEYNVFAVPGWAGEKTIVAVLGTEAGDRIALVNVTDPEQGRIKEVLWKRGEGLDVEPSDPAYSAATRRCVFAGKVEGKGRALYSLRHGEAGPPRRLEPEVFDNVLHDVAFSPDGRYVVFRSDRPDRPRPGQAAVGRRPSVDAPALTGIKIDGDLGDWPAAMPRHAIRNAHTFPPFNGLGGLDGADLTTSPDFSAAFSVGYDPERQLIYLAVIVRDDSLIVGNTSSWDTDSIEVYVDGRHSKDLMPYPEGSDWVETLSASDVPALQYIGIPGKGRIYGFTKSEGVVRKEAENPILMFGDIKKTKTRMAFRRDGEVTTYEWAIQAFDHYPDKPTKLIPGKRIGFDVVLCDKDKPAQTPRAANDPEEDRATWICWGPHSNGHSKSLNAGNLGEIVLGRAP